MTNFTQEYIENYIQKKIFSPIPEIVIEETVKEILKIAKKELKKPIKELSVLDIGSGLGEYAFEIEKYVNKVTGVEPYNLLYRKAINAKKTKKSKVKLRNLLIENFKTKEKFDLVLSLTTLEHMHDAENSFRHIITMLKPGGMIYLTAPNKLWPFEPHYGNLPFLGWLPLTFSNIYLRITGWSGSYKDCSYAKTYFGIKKMLNNLACTYYFYLPQKEAAYLGCAKKGSKHLFRDMGIDLIRKFPIFWVISKGFIVIIKKNKIL